MHSEAECLSQSRSRHLFKKRSWYFISFKGELIQNKSPKKIIKKINSNNKGVDMIRPEIGLKIRQIINETYSFRCFLIL
jgi:hypothetical protein